MRNLKVENEQLIFLYKASKIAIPGYSPKINETGDRGKIVNEENSITIERILSEIARTPQTLNQIKNLFPEENYSNFTCLVLLMPYLCQFYATTEYPESKLKEWAWEHLTVLRLNGYI